jgi:23S rRNA (uracil1939-C5)-methyltransferase
LAAPRTAWPWPANDANLRGVKRGDIAQIQVERIDLAGDSVSKLADRTVSCPGLFPGERATVRIESVSRQHPRAFASLRALEQPHAERRAAPCPNHVERGGACHGCALMALSEAAQRAAKRDMLAAQFGLAVREVEPAPQLLGYRYSSKRVALNVAGELRLGSFAQGSHAPAPMPGCLVDHPRLAAAFDELEREARRLGIEPYDEARAEGDLRYVWGKTDGDAVILTLVTARAESQARALLPCALRSAQGVLASVQAGQSNALRGGPAELLAGRGEITIALLDQRIEVGALGFLQPNPRMAEAAYRALLAPLRDGRPYALAFDLYAGAGVTTRALRERGAEVLACEAFPESAALLGIEPSTAEAFLAHQLAAGRTPDLVIANPPRKGLGAAVTDALQRLGAPALRIMSCGPAGLARDLSALAPAYQLIELRAFDTLPQTPHVELVASLQLTAPAP